MIRGLFSGAVVLGFMLFLGNADAALIHGKDYQNPNGDQVVRVNSSGQVTQTLQAGEDQTNSVMKTEQQFSFAVDDADLVVKAAPGFLHSVWCYPEANSVTAGTVRITNTTAAGGAETTEVWGDDFAAAAYRPIGAVLDIVMTNGIVIDFTTTANVKCGVSYR
jgi:hypothetical protein